MPCIIPQKKFDAILEGKRFFRPDSAALGGGEPGLGGGGGAAHPRWVVAALKVHTMRLRMAPSCARQSGGVGRGQMRAGGIGDGEGGWERRGEPTVSMIRRSESVRDLVSWAVASRGRRR
jgi:hypothetical protein